jgi:hypothetical protein
MPNVATALAVLAVTVSAVEWIVRREAQRRMRPRVEIVMTDLRLRLSSFAHSVAMEYGGTHLWTFRPIPKDVIAFLDHWLEECDRYDACDVREDGPPRSPVVDAAIELGRTLNAVRERDREVMEPELVRAIDDFLWRGVQHGLLFTQKLDSGHVGHERAESYRLGERVVVAEGKKLIEVFTRCDGGRRLIFDDLALAATEQHSKVSRNRDWYYDDMRFQMRRERRARERDDGEARR